MTVGTDKRMHERGLDIRCSACSVTQLSPTLLVAVCVRSSYRILPARADVVAQVLGSSASRTQGIAEFVERTELRGLAP